MQYFVVARHPESEANAGLKLTADGLFYSMCGSDMLVPQTGRGLRQGLRLAKRLAVMFPPHRRLHEIHHSDFLRVAQAIPPITSRLGYDVEVKADTRLRKRSYGRFWNLTHRGVETLHPEEWQRYLAHGVERDLHYRAPDGGENYFDLFARVDDFTDRVVMTSRGNMLVVTHSVVVLAFQRRFEGLADMDVVRRYEAQTLPNAHALIYRRKSNTQPWQRCRRVA